ncbi:hypothetical protein HNP32_000039 [Brevundimonas bullata]|jgi:hypothetical protein|uniref:Uncharacterized protein n=1 Tax=Brevundimonas bullata TaxID=13160 RepID=A0A7W7N1K4_9CAUL|nr:hypothetical protein [Brevundimonas bullata]MBB6381285.1 hypothetical protein [Brevundimonas bullata]
MAARTRRRRSAWSLSPFEAMLLMLAIAALVGAFLTAL